MGGKPDKAKRFLQGAALLFYITQRFPETGFLTMHWAFMRAIFALMVFTRILHRPEGTLSSPFLFGFFSALWTVGFLALVYGCKQFEIVSAFWTAVLIKRHCMFPPDKDVRYYNP